MFTYALRAPETRRQYPRRLKVFFDFLWPGLTLIKQAANFVQTAKKDRPWAEDSFMKFIEYQKQRCKAGEISESTVPNYYKAVKLFCVMNDLLLNWDKIARGMPRGRKAANDRAPTIDEIKKLIEYPDRRIKPIVYVMASSGIRIGAWNELQWKHVTPINNDNGEIGAAKLTVYPGDPEEYFTFITLEAYAALKDWMDFRSEYGEVVTGESWLMRDIWQTSNMKYGAKFGLATNPKKLSSIAITRLLERAAWEQGLRKKLSANSKRHEWKVAHGFRKYFKTRTEFAGMKSLHVETLMGHDTGITESYIKPTENELLKEYLNVAEELTINNESHKIQRKIVELQQSGRDTENMLKAKLLEKDDQFKTMFRRQENLEVQFMEILRIAKTRNGMIRKDKSILDHNRNVVSKYVDDHNQISTVKIPIDSVEILDDDDVDSAATVTRE